MENVKGSQAVELTTDSGAKSERVWVKPVLERLSLTQALAAPSSGMGDAGTPGS